MEKNKKSKVKAPFHLMLAIVERGDGEALCEFLEKEGITRQVLLMGQGMTDNGGMADLFGFGMTEKDIVCVFVPAKDSSTMLKMVKKQMNFGKSHRGMAMIVPLASAASNMLNLLINSRSE